MKIFQYFTVFTVCILGLAACSTKKDSDLESEPDTTIEPPKRDWGSLKGTVTLLYDFLLPSAHATQYTIESACKSNCDSNQCIDAYIEDNFFCSTNLIGEFPYSFNFIIDRASLEGKVITLKTRMESESTPKEMTFVFEKTESELEKEVSPETTIVSEILKKRLNQKEAGDRTEKFKNLKAQYSTKRMVYIFYHLGLITYEQKESILKNSDLAKKLFETSSKTLKEIFERTDLQETIEGFESQDVAKDNLDKENYDQINVDVNLEKNLISNTIANLKEDGDGDGVFDFKDCDPTDSGYSEWINAYPDRDGDGYPSSSQTEKTCRGTKGLMPGWVLSFPGTLDCNDNPNGGGVDVYRNVTLYQDFDNDGYYTSENSCIGKVTPEGSTIDRPSPFNIDCNDGESRLTVPEESNDSNCIWEPKIIITRYVGAAIDTPNPFSQCFVPKRQINTPSIREGRSMQVGVKLSHPVKSDLTVALRLSNQYAEISHQRLVFTAENYGVDQMVIITPKDDDTFTGQPSSEIIASLGETEDLLFAEVEEASYSFSIIDDEGPGIVVSTTNTTGFVSEKDGRLTIGIKLASRPQQDVSLTFAPSTPSFGRIEQTHFRFHADDWDEFKMITYLPTDNNEMSGDRSLNLQLVTPTTSDYWYKKFFEENAINHCPFTLKDNELPSFKLASTDSRAWVTSHYGMRLYLSMGGHLDYDVKFKVENLSPEKTTFPAEKIVTVRAGSSGAPVSHDSFVLNPKTTFSAEDLQFKVSLLEAPAGSILENLSPHVLSLKGLFLTEQGCSALNTNGKSELVFTVRDQEFNNYSGLVFCNSDGNGTTSIQHVVGTVDQPCYVDWINLAGDKICKQFPVTNTFTLPRVNGNLLWYDPPTPSHVSGSAQSSTRHYGCRVAGGREYSSAGASMGGYTSPLTYWNQELQKWGTMAGRARYIESLTCRFNENRWVDR